MKRGFTLVEILVVIAVVSVVGVIITTIFIRSLRGSNKAQIISQIKQNGQIVLENMDKTIRNADNLVCASNNPDNTLVIRKSGLYTRYRVALPQNNTVPVVCLANGCIAHDNPSKQIDQATGKEETDPLLIQRVCLPNDSMQQAAVLTDTNSQTGVKIVSGSFTPNKLPGFKNAVKISFVLGPGSEAPEAVAGQIDPVTFETTVQLR